MTNLGIDQRNEQFRAEFNVLDERFERVHGDDRWERLFSNGRWTEGPLYVPAGRYLLFSDIPNNRVLRWDETSGHVSEFDTHAGYANGRTLDRQGRVVTCEQGSRRVSRVEHDGHRTILADHFEGARLNSPNDVIVSRDGTIWFTDPSYGIDSDYEGEAAPSELDACHVFRIDPTTNQTHSAAADLIRPNGLAFSADEQQLYIVDTRRNHIRVFDVHGNTTLSERGVFAECSSGKFDGIRLDTMGRIWAAAGDGIHCFDPDGTLIGKLELPEASSNLTFGGPKRNRLFVTATTSLYSILLNVNGVDNS